MSIATEITRINNNIANAYTAANSKGATMPATQNSANLAACIDSITTGGGGGGGTGKYNVKVIDYDGTIIDELNLNENDVYTLPSAPTHTGLTFSAWSSPILISNGTITMPNRDVIIGATYTTTSGKDEYDFEIHPSLNSSSVVLNVTGTKDWGDGSINTNTSHSYSSFGKYTVKVDTTGYSSTNGLFDQTSSNRNVYCTAVRFGCATSIPQTAFKYCDSLQSISLCPTITSIGTDAFNACRSINQVIIPSSVTTFGSSIFRAAESLRYVVLSRGITTMPDGFIRNLGSVPSFCIPDTITRLTQFCLMSSGIHRLNIPSTVNSIGSYGCGSIYCCTMFDFSKHTAVPSLDSSTAFDAINKICKIVVPDSLYSSWKTTTNWTNYANYIYKVSEVTL